MLDNSLTVWNDFDDMWKRIDSMFNRSSKSLTRLEKRSPVYKQTT